MKTMRKRFLSLFLAVVMVVSSMPMALIPEVSAISGYTRIYPWDWNDESRVRLLQPEHTTTKVLDVNQGGSGEEAWLWDKVENNNQKIIIEPAPGNGSYFRLRSQLTGLSLGTKDNKNDERIQIVSRNWDGSNSMQWEIHRSNSDPNLYVFRNRASPSGTDRVLDNDANIFYNRFILYNLNSGNRQRFRLLDTTPAKQTITFNANGGSVSPTSQSFDRAISFYNKSLPTPSRGGHSFWGWYEKNGGNSSNDADWGKNITDDYYREWWKTHDIEVYARWSPITVSSVSLTPSTAIDFNVGEERWLTATLSPSNPLLPGVWWTSTNSNVATIVETSGLSGKLKGIKTLERGKPSHVTIQAISNSGSRYSNSVEVTVRQPAEKVSNISSTNDEVVLSPKNHEIIEGQERQLIAEVHPWNVTNTNIVWSTEDSDIATVSSAGLVTAHSPGSAVIVAKSQENAKCQFEFNITVVPPPPVFIESDIPFNPVPIRVGETLQLKPLNEDGVLSTDTPFTWTSSNTSVATINGSGLLEGVSPGTANITVKNGYGSTYVLPITVIDVSLSHDSIELILNDDTTRSQQLTASVQPDDTFVGWESDNEDVAKVIDGLVTAHSPGTATITAAIAGREDFIETCTVTVRPFKEDGTKADPYIIKTAEDLELLSWLVNEGYSGNGEFFSLGSDIDLDGITWVPIGSRNYTTNTHRPFNGTFNGNDYAISGLSVNTNIDLVGLFGYVGISGQVMNLEVKNAEIAGGRYAGGIAGFSSGVITNCSVIGGNVQAGGEKFSENAHSGGIVGYLANSGQIVGSFSTAAVTANTTRDASAGGIVGSVINNGDSERATITTSFSRGNVYAESSNNSLSYASAGGLVGYIEGDFELHNCYSRNEVISRAGGTAKTDSAAGGLIGRIKNIAQAGSSWLANNYSTSSVFGLTTVLDNPASAQERAGNLIGVVYENQPLGTNPFENTSHDTTNFFPSNQLIAGSGHPGVSLNPNHLPVFGAAMEEDEMKFSNSFPDTWKFDTIWEITGANNGFPSLRGMNNDVVTSVTGVEFEVDEITIAAGDVVPLTAIITPYNATNKAVRWSSSDAKIASVDKYGDSLTGSVNGTIRAGNNVGTATITATTSDGGYIASVIVNIKPKVKTPQAKVSPASNSGELEINLFSNTPDTVIHYTVDGTTPTTDSPVYTNPFVITTHTLVRAIAVKSGYANSDVAGFLYRVTSATDPIARRTDSGEILPSGEPVTLPVGTLVTITGAAYGSTLRYTTDGSEPTENSPALSAPIRIDKNMTVTVRAFSKNHFNSDIVTFNFIAKIATPVFNPQGGSAVPLYSSVSILCETPDSETWYTLNDSEPVQNGANSFLYSSPIEIDSAVTIKSKAFKNGCETSETSVASFTISNKPTIETDTVSDKIESGSSIRLSSSDSHIRNAEIRYTPDGSTPTINSELAWESAVGGGGVSYPITITDPVTIRAGIFNTVTGNLISEVEDYSFSVVTARPTANHATLGSIDLKNEFVLSNITKGAVMHYTIDGSTPNVNSKIYTKPISIWDYFADVDLGERITISVKAFRDGLPPSSTTTFSYTVTGERVAQPQARLNTANGQQIFGSATIKSTDKVVFVSSTAGAEIRFTTNGTMPNKNSQLYTSPIRLTSDTTFTVRAFKNGMAVSGTAIYSFNKGAVTPETHDLNIPNVNVPIPADTPFLGSNTFALDFSKVNLELYFDDEKIRGTIGFSLPGGGGFEDEVKFANVKQMLQSGNLKQMTSFVKDIQSPPQKIFANVNAGFEVFGYVEGFWSQKDGETFDKLIGQIGVKFQVGAEVEFIVFPLVVASVGMGAEVSVSGGIQWTAKEGFESKFNLGAEIFLEVRAGVGVPILGSAGVYGRGSFNFDWDFKNHVEASINGELGLYGKFLIWEEKHSLVGPGELWNNKPSPQISSFSMFSAADFDLDTSDNYELASRDYLSTQSDWLESPISSFGIQSFGAYSVDSGDYRVLQESVYDQTAPLIAETNGKRVMVFLTDDGSRSDMNRTILMYSVYNNVSDTWSEPKPVHDDKTADFYPHISSDGNNIWVTWHNSKRVFEDGETITDMMSAAEISVARFNGSTFTDITTLTDNDIGTLPRIAVNGSNAVAAWVQNSDNDIFSMSNAIMVSELASGTWSTPRKLTTVSGSVAGMDITYFNGKAHIAYAVNNIDDWQANEDRDLIIMDLDGNETELVSESLVSNPAFTIINEEQVLSWYENGSIRCMTADKNIHTLLELPTDNFKIFSNAHNTAVVYPTWEDGLGFFTAQIYQGNSWGKPFVIAKTDDFAKSFDGVWDNDGTLHLAFNNSRMAIIGEDLIETNDLCVLEVNPQNLANIKLESVSFENDEVVAGKKLNASAEIVNIGGATISSVNVSVDGKKITTVSLGGGLRTGQTQTINFDIDIPANLSKTEPTPFIIEVEPVGIDDTDIKDNSYTISVGLPSLSLSLTKTAIDETDINSPIRVTAAVENTTTIPVNANLVVRRGSLEGEILDVIELGVVSGQETMLEEFVVSPISFVSEDEDWELLFFELVSDRQEYFSANTSDFAVIHGAEPASQECDCNECGCADCFPPDGICDDPTCSICSENKLLEVIKVAENAYVEIRNNTDKAISTKGLYLSDNSGKLLLWQMPAVIIRPGETVKIVGKDYSGSVPFIKRGQTNFDMAGVARIYLSSAYGDVVG